MEELLSRPELTASLRKICEKRSIPDFEISQVRTNQKGEGYLGEIFLVTLLDKTSKKDLHLVIKAAFKSQKIRDFAPIRKSFENEIFFYEKISITLQEFSGESLDFLPKCYETSLEDRSELLVLEDLRELGFEVFSKHSVLTGEHISLIFETYGKFHAVSFAIKDRDPEEFQAIAGRLHNLYEEFLKEALKEMSIKIINGVVKCLVPGEDDAIIAKFRKYQDGGSSGIFGECVQTPEHSAILHGDCWSNNMMFKNDGQRPTDIRLIDFQLAKAGSPVCDLSYCLYSGASKEVFDDLERYLRIYHDSLSSTLRGLGCDPEEIYPFSVLERDWKRFSRFGAIMAFSILRMKLTKSEDLIDLTDVDDPEDFSKFEKLKFDEEGYGVRIRGLLSHLHQIDAL